METTRNIYQQIGSPQGLNLEYQAVLPPARSLAQMIAAFANTEGGTIILGIIDVNNEIVITGLSEDFQVNSVTHKAVDLLSPKINVNSYYTLYNDKRLYIINVDKSQSPISIEGKLYVRKGTKIVLLKPETKKIINSQYELVKNLTTAFQSYLPGTGSKNKFIEHYQSVLNIVDDLGAILYPNNSSIATINQEGKILMRILLASCADNFELYLSDLLYEIYLAKPETLKSNQQVTIKEVLDCADMQEFVLFWAKKKLSKLQRGSVKGFIADNAQIKDLNVLDEKTQDKIEEILQIRHLYVHRNGVVDEKFLQFFPKQHNLNDEHKLSADDLLNYLSYLAGITNNLDTAAIKKYNLATL